jgi:hypothetical protein
MNVDEALIFALRLNEGRIRYSIHIMEYSEKHVNQLDLAVGITSSKTEIIEIKLSEIST